MTKEEQIATELIERTKWNESPHYAGCIEGDGWWFTISAVFCQDSLIPVWWECSDDTVEIEEIRRIFQSKLRGV